ncbi:MAG: hypothetical protein IJ658_10270 [Kiritimatiellae bacterium]|nr:hypothetical protein [Kiritimatiellia bacterium]
MALGNTHSTTYPEVVDFVEKPIRVGTGGEAISNFIHTDAVYNALMNAAYQLEDRLKESLKNYQEHPDVQANLQQLQYDLQQWNLALTTMTNINKNMGDALNSIASNFR